MKSRSVSAVFLNEKLVLITLIALYLCLEVIAIALPGLYADEAFPACGSLQIIKQIGPFMQSLKIGRIHFPVMLCEYETALESYIVLPFLWLFGIQVVTLRLVPIGIGVLTLLFTYLFLKEVFSRQVGLLSLFLLVINPAFLLETKLGLNSASMLHCVSMVSLWSLFRWITQRRCGYLYLGVLFLALGISIRVWFAWFVISLLLLAFFFHTMVYQRLKGNTMRYFSVCVLFFLLGSGLFVVYNLSSDFGTVRYIAQHFSQTQNDISNFEYLHNLRTRIDMLVHYLRGTRPLDDQGGWFNRTPLKALSANGLYPYLLLGAFLWLSVSIGLHRATFARKRILAIMLLFTFILLQTPFTLSSLGGPHLFIMFPLVQMIIGLGLVDFIRNMKRYKIVVLAVCLLFSVFIVFECNTAFKNNYRYLQKSGGTGNNSDSIYTLTRYLQDKKINKPMVMDWGFLHNLIFLSQGSVIPVQSNYVEGGFDKKTFIGQCRSSLNSTVFIFHAPEFTNRPEIYAIFKNIVEESGKTLQQEKIFYQRDKRPIYVVYSVR